MMDGMMSGHGMMHKLILIPALLLFFPAAADEVERVEILYHGTFGKYFHTYPVPTGTIFSVRKADPEHPARIGTDGVRIVIAPRPLKEPGLTSVPIAYQAVLLAVNLRCKVRDVTSAQVRSLLNDGRGSWRTFGGPSARIRLYAKASPELPPPVMPTDEEHNHPQTRPRTILDPKPLGDVKAPEVKPVPTVQYFRPLRVQTENDRSSFILLSADPFGMACFDITRYNEDRVRLLTVDGIAPTLDNFRSGKYPLTTIWYLTFPEKPTDAERPLIRYIRGRKFAAMVYQDGMLPELPEKLPIKPSSVTVK